MKKSKIKLILKDHWDSFLKVYNKPLFDINYFKSVTYAVS